MPNSEKIRLREVYLSVRSRLGEKERQQAQAKIAETLFALAEIERSVHIAFYCSYGNEVDTRPLMRFARERGKSVYLPTIAPLTKEMIFSAHDGCYDDMSCNALGILEPSADPVSLDTLEVIIVPGVAFDQSGNRLGHGAGYYDRFLKKVCVPKIAVAFEAQLADVIPAGPNDVGMDMLVTEAGVRRF